jgi:hypothetical protein
MPEEKTTIRSDGSFAKAVDVLDESTRIVKTAEDEGVVLRLMGGLAFRVHCHGPHSAHLRAYQDIDLFGLTKQSKKLFSVFKKLGYLPNVKFNALYGERRMEFIGPEGHDNVDLFLDKFSMQHTLDFRERVRLDDLTIPVTDLLLTKLQNVSLAEKDERDIVAIVEDHEIGSSDAKEIINKDYVARLCSRDWGLCQDVIENTDKMTRLLEASQTVALDKDMLIDKLATIEKAIKSVPKKFRWKLRNIVGKRVQWYNEVELGEAEV